jgi:uncharacterized repeat protein (TIGR01451 family)
MKFFELKMRVIAPLVVICCFVFFGSQPALAQVVLKTDPGTNNPPPAGAILDLSGTPIPTGSSYGTYGAYQRYTVNFVADITNTAITFAFREDPARISLANASVTDLTHPSGNLLVNGDFSGGMYNSNGNGRTPNGWTYANIYGVLGGGGVFNAPSSGGFVDCLTSTFCWNDGAVQAVDAISQTIPTTVGDTYQIAFFVADNSGCSTGLAPIMPCNFSNVSTNGDTTDQFGNGIDVAVYAQAGLPVAATPTTYTSDTNIADFTSGMPSYATFSNFSSTEGACVSSFTPTSAEVEGTPCRVYGGTLPIAGTNLPNNNWILAAFPSAVSRIEVYPNIDHFGSAYDGYQYQIYGSNDLTTWTALFDAASVHASNTATGEPFTLGTFTGTAPSTVNNVLTPGAGPGGTVGYIAQFQFPAAYKYYAFGASTVAFAQGNPDQELSAVTSSYTTPPQTIAPGQTNTFTDSTKINQSVMIPFGSDLGFTQSMEVKFIEVPQAVFDTTRLPATSTNTWSGGKPVPVGTTCTPIPSANNNCVVMEQICFSDAAGTTRIPCEIAAGGGAKILLASTYTGTSLPPNPGYFTASDGLNDWADITTTTNPDCCTLSGGTNRINTDYFIGDKPPIITITAPVNTTYFLNQAVAASYICTEPPPPAANPPNPPPPPPTSCTASNPGLVLNGGNIDTASVGSKTFTVSSTDVVGTAGSASVAYTVVDLPVDLDLFYFAPSTVRPGSNLTYLLAAVNFAQTNAASGVVVTDTVPAGTTVVKAIFAKISCSPYGCSAMPTQGTACGVSGRVVTCNIGSLAPLNTGTGVGIAIVVSVPATTPLNTLLTDTATITSLNRDTDLDRSVSIKTTVSKSY